MASERAGSSTEVKRLEGKVEELSGQVRNLQAQLKKKFVADFPRKLSANTLETLTQMRNFDKNSRDVINKAQLFDEGYLKREFS